MHIYEVRPRKDERGVDLISYALPFGRLWYAERNAISSATGYAKHCSPSHDGVLRLRFCWQHDRDQGHRGRFQRVQVLCSFTDSCSRLNGGHL